MSGTGRVDRLRDGLRRRLSGATGLDEVEVLGTRVDSLEVAVAENHALQVPLSVLVDDLERDVAEVLSRRTGTGMGA